MQPTMNVAALYNVPTSICSRPSTYTRKAHTIYELEQTTNSPHTTLSHTARQTFIKYTHIANQGNK